MSFSDMSIKEEFFTHAAGIGTALLAGGVSYFGLNQPLPVAIGAMVVLSGTASNIAYKIGKKAGEARSECKVSRREVNAQDIHLDSPDTP